MLERSTSFLLPISPLSNDELRNKTQEFRQRIKEHLTEIDAEIAAKNKAAEELPFNDLMGKDAIYQEVDKLKKDRDKKIEEILEEILTRSICSSKRNSPPVQRKYRDRFHRYTTGP